MLVSKHATREMCPSLYVFHHFHVLFEDEKTLKDKSQREKYAPQFLDVRVVFFVRFKVCRPFEARECGRERERVREQQQDFSTSHGEKRAQDLAIHIIFVFSNRSVHPSAEVPIKIKLKQTPTPSSSWTPTTSCSCSWTPQQLLLVTHNFFFLDVFQSIPPTVESCQGSEGPATRRHERAIFWNRSVCP